MNLQDLFNQVLFSLGQATVTLGEVILSGLVLIIVAVIYRMALGKWLPRYFEQSDVPENERVRTFYMLSFILLLLAIILVMRITGLDYALYTNVIEYGRATETSADDRTETRNIWISTLLLAALIYFTALLLDWMISRLLTRNYLLRREALQSIAINFEQPRIIAPARRLVQPIVYVLALMFITYTFHLDRYFVDELTLTDGDETITFKISTILSGVLVLLIARLFIWILTDILLFPYYQRKEINIGSQYAINQLFKYFIYVFAILIALQTMGISVTLLLGGAAALLVGIGLGLQQTFNDLISGIILLSERSIEIGDMLSIGGSVGTVRRIGLRTSLIETRDNMTLVVPNSKLIGDMIVNWSHDEDKARFSISVGVAYGSDTALVRKILLQVASEHPKSMKRPAPVVRFIEFADSSLNFQLFFWCKDFLRIEDVKSDMRFETDRLFREHRVTIPFPQRDIWIRQEDIPKPDEPAPEAPLQ